MGGSSSISINISIDIYKGSWVMDHGLISQSIYYWSVDVMLCTRYN